MVLGDGVSGPLRSDGGSKLCILLMPKGYLMETVATME